MNNRTNSNASGWGDVNGNLIPLSTPFKWQIDIADLISMNEEEITDQPLEDEGVMCGEGQIISRPDGLYVASIYDPSLIYFPVRASLSSVIKITMFNTSVINLNVRAELLDLTKPTILN